LEDFTDETGKALSENDDLPPMANAQQELHSLCAGWVFPGFTVIFTLLYFLYQKKYRGPMRNNSIFAYPKSSERKTESSTGTHSSMSYSHLRRPINPDLLKVRRSTIAWARSIPSDVRPRALVIKFPRIANILAAAWSDPIRFNKALNEFMVDTRGKRQGFPLDVLQDLANLRAYFDRANKPAAKVDIWNTVLR
jgi:hypothetical protein